MMIIVMMVMVDDEFIIIGLYIGDVGTPLFVVDVENSLQTLLQHLVVLHLTSVLNYRYLLNVFFDFFHFDAATHEICIVEDLCLYDNNLSSLPYSRRLKSLR